LLFGGARQEARARDSPRPGSHGPNQLGVGYRFLVRARDSPPEQTPQDLCETSPACSVSCLLGNSRAVLRLVVLSIYYLSALFFSFFPVPFCLFYVFKDLKSPSFMNLIDLTKMLQTHRSTRPPDLSCSFFSLTLLSKLVQALQLFSAIPS
jgi:hypothetical protein